MRKALSSKITFDDGLQLTFDFEDHIVNVSTQDVCLFGSEKEKEDYEKELQSTIVRIIGILSSVG